MGLHQKRKMHPTAEFIVAVGAICVIAALPPFDFTIGLFAIGVAFCAVGILSVSYGLRRKVFVFCSCCLLCSGICFVFQQVSSADTSKPAVEKLPEGFTEPADVYYKAIGPTEILEYQRKTSNSQ